MLQILLVSANYPLWVSKDSLERLDHCTFTLFSIMSLSIIYIVHCFSKIVIVSLPLVLMIYQVLGSCTLCQCQIEFLYHELGLKLSKKLLITPVIPTIYVSLLYQYTLKAGHCCS